MDINNMELLNDSGLSSLSGFSYQIKVFILRLTQLQQGQRVEFETLDDVAVRSLSSKDSISDSCFKWKVDETSSIEVFQVKQTNVSESVRRQVLYNWLLAYNQKPDISKFTLYVAQGYSINEKAFTNDSEKEYQTIIESDKAVTALVSRVKQIYKDDLTKFKRDYQTICSKSTIERLGDIDELIAEQLITPFHATAADIGKTYFEKRIAELFTRICARIMDCAGQRSPYVCGHAEYMQLCEEICKDISPTQYTPDYEAFRQVFSQDDLTSEITNSREYRQLRYCKLSNSEILDHLSWEQYYQSIRQHYLADAKKDAISKTESIAHQNHKDVVYELQDENKDTPRLRLIKTKRCEISTLHDEFSRWGTYIFLTQNDLPNKISWKDEDEDANEQ
ncbi:MAG: hypothetical protein BHV91_00080 [Clostridiales bacterium 44_9]|jgi:hypothetical protein|uniref:hypothetical protein n=2 Tax=Gemmiger formicilis TaxID=745368 RepID=UPI00096908B1|nr:MAG: hypothetical protein BHV91_00080 [Clostridiales bacterium 44_9]